MKTCRTCQKTYDDDTMVYCLDDGARLVDSEATPNTDATLNLPVGPTVHAEQLRPVTAANPQPTITAKPEHFQMPYSPGTVASDPKPHKSSLPWIFAIVVVLGISGVVTAWLLTRGDGGQTRGGSEVPTPIASPRSSPQATAEEVETPRIQRPEPTPTGEISKPTPKPTPTPTREKPAFATLNNMTFNGSRITYYPRQSFAQCQADCAGNASCRGFTWIRPGAYNPGDSAMCYLMSAVTARVPHACCISGVRN